jgi:hypothetical protein
MANKTVAALVGLGVIAGTAALAATLRATQGSPGTGGGTGTGEKDSADRWRVVTVQADVDPQGLPAPLAGLADQIDIRTAPAPGGRGTELSARPRPGAGDADSPLVGRIRRALRESKQLLETDEVATNEPQPEGHRPTTPAGLLVDAVTRRSPEGGVL